VLETAHGPELGTAAALRDPTAEESAKGLKPVLRRATTDDVERYQKWESKSGEAVARGRELAQKLNLAMKPIAARYNLDGSHLTIYFTAGERIDFRDLVRELRQALHTRVELRQVGPRDEAKLIGAVGKCGRHLCCMTFINEFQPISIRMAKDQDLSLSPMKVSGVCGRLLCCLGYEAEQYRTLRERSPRVGQEASSPSGKGKVVSLNPLKETVMLEIGTESAVEVPISQLTWEKRPRPQSEGQPEDANQGRQGGDRRKRNDRDRRRRGENRPPVKPAVSAEPAKSTDVSGCAGCQACQPVPPGEAPPTS
jgi:cell fate regulator YaaT (PSP1 superfamily)